MACVSVISTLSDIAVGGAAIIAATVAWRGLSTWRDQMRGTVEYELARRVLMGVYRVRDAVSRVRNPVMMTTEMPEPPQEKFDKMSRDQLNYYGVSTAYQTRWNLVIEARRELAADLLEAEALWGEGLKTRMSAMRRLEGELYFGLSRYLRAINPDESAEMREATTRISRGQREVLYEMGEGEADQFRDEYMQAIKNVEDALSPHLRRV